MIYKSHVFPTNFNFTAVFKEIICIYTHTHTHIYIYIFNIHIYKFIPVYLGRTIVHSLNIFSLNISSNLSLNKFPILRIKTKKS